MGLEVRVEGLPDLARVQHRLKQVGDRGLGKQMGRALRDAAGPLSPAVRAEARSAMPARYGAVLAPSLRLRTTVRDAAHTSDVQIKIYGQGRRARRHVPALNRGRLRHPLYGNRGRWYAQGVRPGFVDRPFDKLKPGIVEAMRAVLDDVADQLGA